MAKYSIKNHSLSFGQGFKKLIVTPEEGDAIEYSLIQEGKGIQLEITNEGEYQISEVTISFEPRIAIEHLGNGTLEFNQSMLGGTVVIDLRDMGRYGEPSTGTYSATFALGGTPHIFWNTRKGKGFKMYFENVYCHEFRH